MGQRIGGQGQGLLPAQFTFPSQIPNDYQDVCTNEFVLSPGDTIAVPPGTWNLTAGVVAVLQYNDPVTGVWRGFNPTRDGFGTFTSDGANYRLTNSTGCPIAAVVANGGTNYASGTTSVVSTTGGSTWKAIVGGALSVVSLSAVGANYTVPPIVLIPSPTLGAGVAATGYATIANGTVSGVTLVDVGAGYTNAPTALLIPSPSDPNFGSITNASVVLGTTYAGKITAVLCTNIGAPLPTISALTLTASGAGSGATITPVVMQCVTGATVVGGGGGYVAANALMTVGGNSAATSAIGNPSVEVTNFVPRIVQAQFAVAAGAITSVSSIIDPGMYVAAPTPIVLNNGVTTTAATITLTMGSTVTRVLLQPGVG